MTMIRHSRSSKMSELRSESGLSIVQIAEVAPSILASEAHDSRGKRYAFISTRVILEALQREGFIPVEARQTIVRKMDRRDYTKHMVRFRHPDAKQNADGDYPEIVLVNSHDGTSSYRLFSGYFRMICSNGLICGHFMSDIKIRHSGKVELDVVEGAFKVIDDIKDVSDVIDEFKSINLVRQDRLRFADAARKLRWGIGEKAPVQAGELALPRRHEDHGHDLWTTFNVVQENIVKGGVPGKTVKGTKLTTRPVQGVTENVKLNRVLWDLAKSFADLKTGRLQPEELIRQIEASNPTIGV